MSYADTEALDSNTFLSSFQSVILHTISYSPQLFISCFIWTAYVYSPSLALAFLDKTCNISIILCVNV